MLGFTHQKDMAAGGMNTNVGNISIKKFPMKSIKRILSMIVLLSLCVCALGACSGEQEKDVFDIESNVSLKLENDNQLCYTQSPLHKEFSLLDSDGDGTADCIIELSLMDLFGGNGDYIIQIYAKGDTNKYDEIVFNSTDYLLMHKNMDIAITELKDKSIVFGHQKTQYQIEYVVDESTYLYIFNPDGTPKGCPHFVIDPFKNIEVVGDELVMQQYVSLGWHANYIGDCISVWKVVDDELTLVSVQLVFD